jgi:hypothetical protein
MSVWLGTVSSILASKPAAGQHGLGRHIDRFDEHIGRHRDEALAQVVQPTAETAMRNVFEAQVSGDRDLVGAGFEP